MAPHLAPLLEAWSLMLALLLGLCLVQSGLVGEAGAACTGAGAAVAAAAAAAEKEEEVSHLSATKLPADAQQNHHCH